MVSEQPDRPSSTAGLSPALLREVLRLRPQTGKPLSFSPTLFDSEMLAAADAAVTSRVPLAIVQPLPSPRTPVILGAAAVVGAVMTNRGADVSVAVAATNLAARTTYDRLFLRDVRLADLVSRTRVTADGTVQEVRRRGGGTRGHLDLTGSLGRLTPLLDTLDAVVVDSSAGSPAEIITFATAAAGHTPLLYLTANPLDPALTPLREAGVLVWGWDTLSVGHLSTSAHTDTVGEAMTVPQHVLADASNSTVTVTSPLVGGDLDIALTALWRALGALTGAYERHRASSRPGTAGATRWAWSLYHVAATLPVSATRYDDHATINSYMPVPRTVCTQCAARRDLTADDLLPKIRIAGAAAFVEESLADQAQALVY